MPKRDRETEEEIRREAMVVYDQAYARFERRIWHAVLNLGLAIAIIRARKFVYRISKRWDHHYFLIGCPKDKGRVDACLDFLGRHRPIKEKKK